MSLLTRLVCLVRGHRWGAPRRVIHLLRRGESSRIVVCTRCGAVAREP